MKASFRKKMASRPEVKRAGKIVVIYIPSRKLNRELRKQIHDFLVKHYRAYTHEKGVTNGYWMNGEEMAKDRHEKYLVSLGEAKNLDALITFSSEICRVIKESCLYFTVGDESYLVSSTSGA
jgi:hypothetical protein